jgi:hypothetical protein
MNLLLLLLGVRVWAGGPVEIMTRVFCAVSLFSLEMQLATWSGAATLRSLTMSNAGLAAALFFFDRKREAEPGATSRPPGRAAAVLVALAGLVVLLNGMLPPLTAADPYHVARADRIQAWGTLAYDAAADPKLNVLGWLYELLLADIRAIPIAGEPLARFHGLAGLALLMLSVAAVLQIFGARSRLAWMLACVVPVAFHQYVLVKNDLFGAVPALLVLAWIAARLRHASSAEVGWAAWLAGIAVGMKLTSFPLAVVLAGAVLVERRDLRILGAAAGAAAVGLLAGGLLFTLVENHQTYGSSLEPIRALGNRNTSLREIAVSVSRFVISLFDFGLFTGRWWPGRGGWAGTYGLPLIWALVVLLYARQRPAARRTLGVAIAYWALFAAAYPDADLAHRLALAPGLLVVVVAATFAEQDPAVPPWCRAAAIPVVILSAAQIVRSAALYLARA